MSDPDPGSAVTESAADLAASASGGEASGSAGEAAADAAADAAGGDKGFLEALFHTDPDLSPEDVEGWPRFVGEAYVGVRKVMDALGVQAGDGDGTPAFVNLWRGAKGAYLYGQERGAEGEESDGDGEDGDAAQATLVTASAQEGGD